MALDTRLDTNIKLRREVITLTLCSNIAGFLSVLGGTFLSDRVKARGPVMIVGCSLAIIGYIMLLVPARPLVHYGG